ncbi:hypothetical protein [Bartonella elizabethae]|uniref:hypothetical protein n=1 Tax=Bartonella elizabethae TaxID=807 RepID=UPI001FD0897D|nr:hypothetical protein [Bartonella elizabethae]
MVVAYSFIKRKEVGGGSMDFIHFMGSGAKWTCAQWVRVPFKKLLFFKQAREDVIEGVSNGWVKKRLKRFKKSYIVAHCKEKRNDN